MDLRRVLRIAESVDTREGKLTLMALLVMMYVIALFLSVAIHEVLGHGLFTVLLGGDFYAFYLSPGSGYALLWFPETMSQSSKVLIYMAGILVQLIIGIAALFFLVKKIKNFMWGLFTLVFSVCMLVLPSLYLFMGYFYRGGDTYYAVDQLGVGPDAFLVAGIILTGIFVFLVSAVALMFLGRYLEVSDENGRAKTLAIFWFPPLLLSGFISFFYSLSLPNAEMAYPLVNSAMLLLFVGAAIFLVPGFIDPVKERDHRMTMGSVFSVLVCFMLLLAGWAGAFGLSRESAHGVLLHEPPIELEDKYRDYSIGNANLMVYSNGTVRVDIVLKNVMENPSPLDRKIYRTFDRRPDWDKYISGSMNIMAGMFGLRAETAENLTFSTGLERIWAQGIVDDWGRRCTAYINLTQYGTRQNYISPGEQTLMPGVGIPDPDLVLAFLDPWKAGGGGFLDRVNITWEEGLEVVEIVVWSDWGITPAVKNLDSIQGNSLVWMNGSPEVSPMIYKISFIITDEEGM